MDSNRRRPLIALFHPHFTVSGGAGNVVLETAHRLLRDADVVVVCLRVQEDIRRLFPDLRFCELGGPLPSRPDYWLRLPLLQWRVHRLLGVLQPDVLLPHVFPANWWAFLWRLFHRSVPCLWYCHEPSAFVHSREVAQSVPAPMRAVLAVLRPLLRWADCLLVRRGADAVVVNSHYTGREVASIYGRQAEGIAWPGADAAQFVPVDAKEPYLLIAGRLSRYKRVHLAIEALALLQHREYRLVVAGDGEEREALHALAVRLGVAGRVEFVGDVPLDGRARLYARATLVLALREFESFGMVPVEAMLCGTPVVAVRSGGVCETVVEGVNGVFLPADDPAAIARTVDALLDDRVLYTRLCRSARASAERFSWEHHLDVLRPVLHTLVQKRRR